MVLEQQGRSSSRGSRGVRWEGFDMDNGPNQSFTQELDTIRDHTRALETGLERWDASSRWEFNEVSESVHAMHGTQARLPNSTLQETTNGTLR
jgi:hypothetical protein